jgi:hypothetical protein
VAPRPRPAAAPTEFRRAGGGVGRGKGQGGELAHLRARGRRSSSEGVVDDGARRHRLVAAAEVGIPLRNAMG